MIALSNSERFRLLVFLASCLVLCLLLFLAALDQLSVNGNVKPLDQTADSQSSVIASFSTMTVPASDIASITPAAQTTNNSVNSVQAEVTTTAGDNHKTATSTQVKVNGQPITLPQNGSVSQSVNQNGQQTQVNVNVNNQTTGSADDNVSSSTSIVQLDSSSSNSTGLTDNNLNLEINQ